MIYLRKNDPDVPSLPSFSFLTNRIIGRIIGLTFQPKVMEGHLNRAFLHTVIEWHYETNKIQMAIVMNLDFVTVMPS